MFRLLVVAPLLVAPLGAWGQAFISHRERALAVYADTLRVDTLSIIPGSLVVVGPQGVPIDSSLYVLLHGSARMVLRPGFPRGDTLTLRYRVFPMLLEREFYHKDYEALLSPDSLLGLPAARYTPRGVPGSPFGDAVRVSGTFMRGLSIGSDQGLAVQSGMNLQLSGELAPGIRVVGAISDQAIPLQPEGATHRLQEFDRIFLGVYGARYALLAGDIELRHSPRGGLLRVTRSVQGLHVQAIPIAHHRGDSLSVEAAAAAARGKFSRVNMQGVEGKQGPYRLLGAQGELYIQVISGSERVFVDGIQLRRGVDQHYEIDYALAEITFTARMPISRHSRIAVEFEYTERSYVRLNALVNVAGARGPWAWAVSAFGEQDARHQPHDMALTPEQMQHLYAIGDDLARAFYPQVDSVGFNPNEILYQRVDTVIGGVRHTFFRHSHDPLAAVYRVMFSHVGPNQGDYVPVFGSANGRVFRWVPPVNGIPQGAFAPMRRLVPPTSTQMVSVASGYRWGGGSGAQLHYALSRTDLNTLSPLGGADDLGHAVRLSLSQGIAAVPGGGRLSVGGSLFASGHGFRPIDRFREQEFERDWAMARPLAGGGEREAEAWVAYLDSARVGVRVAARGLTVGQWYSGAKGRVEGWSQAQRLSTQWRTSYLTSSDTLASTQFLRGMAQLAIPIGLVELGVAPEYEGRRSVGLGTDTLTDQSFEWYSVRWFAQMPDSLPSRMGVLYIFRNDSRPREGAMRRMGQSHEVRLNGQAQGGRGGTTGITLSYRLFHPTDTLLAGGSAPDRTLLARVEHANRLARGFWDLSSGFEIGSGLEAEEEHLYVEVPAGQGVYTWVDYNGNGIRELNEFEVAPFPDQATYVRIGVPGLRMVPVRSSALSLRSSINPSALLRGQALAARLINRFTCQTVFMLSNRNRSGRFWESVNPFLPLLHDTLVVGMTQSLRNSLAFNRYNPRLGADYILMQSASRILQANGMEARSHLSHRLMAWVGLGERYTLRAEGEIFSAGSQSEHFPQRDYSLRGLAPLLSIRGVWDAGLALEVGSSMSQQVNRLGPERSTARRVYGQLEKGFEGRGMVALRLAWVHIDFVGSALSPVAHRMLQGLMPGGNATWEVSLRRRLTQLFEMEVGYSGRHLEGGRAVHTGSVMARALF